MVSEFSGKKFDKFDLYSGLKLDFQINYKQPDFLWNVNVQIAAVCLNIQTSSENIQKTAMQLYSKFQLIFLPQEYKFGYSYCQIQRPRKGIHLVLTILQQVFWWFAT